MNKQHAELLNITLEEAAEVVQAISKIFRFGWDSCHPDRPGHTNKMHLEEEIGDLLCLVEILEERGLVDSNAIAAAFYNKKEKLAKWSNVEL